MASPLSTALALLGLAAATAVDDAASQHCASLGGLVNLARYPIDRFDPASDDAIVPPSRALDAARRAFAETGCASFPDFLTPEALSDAAAEALAAARLAVLERYRVK